MENDIYTVAGKQLRVRRKALGWSQEYLAGKVDTSPSYISQTENAKTKTSLEFIQKLAVAMKVKVANLFKEVMVYYKPSSWERKIVGVVCDRTDADQKRAYKILKETFRPSSSRQKRK